MAPLRRGLSVKDIAVVVVHFQQAGDPLDCPADEAVKSRKLYELTY